MQDRPCLIIFSKCLYLHIVCYAIHSKFSEQWLPWNRNRKINDQRWNILMRADSLIGWRWFIKTSESRFWRLLHSTQMSERWVITSSVWRTVNSCWPLLFGDWNSAEKWNFRHLKFFGASIGTWMALMLREKFPQFIVTQFIWVLEKHLLSLV